MTETTITPSVVGDEGSVELLLDTDLTPTEIAEVEGLELELKQSDATIVEQYILQGEVLHTIQQKALFRSREPGERFTWEEYLKRFTPQLTKNGKGYGIEGASARQLFYLFHTGQISPGELPHSPGERLPLPTSVDQLRPLLSKAPRRHATKGGGYDMTGDWTPVAEIWKGANAKGKPDKAAVAAARSAYEQQQLRMGEDPGRMPSQAQLQQIRSAQDAAQSVRMEFPTRPEAPATPPPTPTIPAWELEKQDDSIDAGEECRRITRAMNDAYRAISTLRGILYSQTKRHGDDYLAFLREVDAGVYSLHNIDEQVQNLGEDVEFVLNLLTTAAGSGDLADSTLDVTAAVQ